MEGFLCLITKTAIPPAGTRPRCAAAGGPYGEEPGQSVPAAAAAGRKRRRINPVLYILCVLVASAILAGVGWLLASDLCFQPGHPSTTKITIEITADDDMGSIAEKAAGRRTDPHRVVLSACSRPSPAPAKEVGIGTHELNTDMDYHALIAGCAAPPAT